MKKHVQMVRVSLLASLGLLAVASSCGDDRPGAAVDGFNNDPEGLCATPSTGCPCGPEGASTGCGTVKQQIGDYVQCSMGNRKCTGGRWGECNGTRIVTKSHSVGGSLRGLALSTAPASCAAINPCDPNCLVYSDTPDVGLVGPGLALVAGAITLSGSLLGSTCTSVTIAPAAASLTVTSLAPLVTSPAALAFTPTFLPAGCVAVGTQPTWTVSRPDLATVDSTGALSLFSGTAGVGLMQVQAFFGTLASNIVPVDVKLRVTQDTSVVPNYPALPAQAGLFWSDPARTVAAVPSAASNATWLYPYADTFFPLGLPPPVVQYKMSANAGNSVKVSLRFPSGSTSAAAVFEYALVVREAACSDPAQCFSVDAAAPPKLKDPQIVIPPGAWDAFEQTAKGADADLIVQRYAGGALQNENPRRVHFVPGQLKGTVFYGTYSSPLVGNTGAVMKVVPGATVPQVGVQMQGRCTTCHIFNDDGTQAYANGYRYPAGGGFNDSQLFNLAVPPSGPGPSAVVLRQFNNGAGTPNPGLRFNYGAARTDGRLYLTHGAAAGGDQNFRAPAAVSTFWDPTTATPTARAVTNWPNNAQAVTPRFSVAGDKIAFAYWAGNALPASPAGTLAADATGRRIAVVDFACTSGVGCPGGTITNARDVTPGAAAIASPAGTNLMAWPTFTPDGASVVYQRQIVNSNAYNGWSPSKLNTTTGAQGEIWMSNITPNASTASTPTRLNALNGLTSAGVNYLPQLPRDIAPQPFATNFHQDGASFQVCVADNCGSCNAGVPLGSDTRLNYRPSTLPVEAGGLHWVVFASRRMYGSIATANPWDVEPNMPCRSNSPQPKKLWVAAVDKTWTPGADPSHPAFYLPGQELAAGNSEAYWVNQACAPLAGACNTNADCCQTPSATQCRIDLPASSPVTRSCQLASACVPTSGTCLVDADCCGSPSSKCLGSGPKVCGPTAVYTASSFTRDFVATCEPSSRVTWQLFQWQSDTPSGATISYSAQTGTSTTTLGAPVAIGAAPPSAGAGSWVSSPTSVDSVLTAAGQSSQSVLRVTVTLDTTGPSPPVLYAWRQLYDCVPTE